MRTPGVFATDRFVLFSRLDAQQGDPKPVNERNLTDEGFPVM